MRKFFGCSILLLVLPGCGPELSKQDLGEVVYEVPQVPGADKPYKIPGLNATEGKDTAAKPSVAPSDANNVVPPAGTLGQPANPPDTTADPRP